MARLWSCGFELQSVTAAVEFTAVIAAPVIETTTKRSGAAALRINNAVSEGFRNVHTASQGAFFFRFYLYVVAMPAATTVIGGARITGSNKISIRLTTGGALQLYNSEDSAQVGSDSSALSTATWYRVEMTYDSTTLSATTCSARIDGTQFASGTVDLAATPTNFGCYHAGDATLDYIVDDIAINDSSGSFQNSWAGEGEIIHLYPNGNGDNSAWTGSDGNSTDNYLLVDEFPPNDATDYVESNTSGQIDDYNLAATPAAMDSSDAINVVQVGVRAAVSDATGSDPDVVIRIKASTSGTVEESASLDVNSATWKSPAPLPSDDNYKLTLYDLPGASTTAWTKADLDTAQIGIREAVTDTHLVRVSAIWLLVDHKPSAGHTIAVGQNNETDTAQAISKIKNKTIGQNTETDTPQAITKVKQLAIAQNVETDSAQAIARIKQKAIGLNSETDVAQTILSIKRVALAQVTETDISQPITARKIKAISQANETDLAQPISTNSAILISQVEETDLAQALFPLKRVAIAQAEESNTSQPITRVKAKTLGQVTETDFAQGISQEGIITVVLGQVVEVDSVFHIARSYTGYIGDLTLYPRRVDLTLNERTTNLKLHSRSVALSLQELE